VGLSGFTLSFVGRPETEQFPEASGSGWSSGYFTLPMRIIVRSQVPGAGQVIGIGSGLQPCVSVNTHNCSKSGPLPGWTQVTQRGSELFKPPAAGCIRTIVRLQGPALVRLQEKQRDREAVQA